MPTRTAKVNTAYTDILQVGASSKTVTLAFYQNGALVASPTSTVAEIGSSGLYKVDIPGGFTSNGHWLVSGSWEASVIYRDVEVTSYTPDDIYPFVSQGSGIKTVTLTFQDTANSNAAVEGLSVDVWNSGGTAFITYGTTNASGQVVFLLAQATYKLKTFKSGFSTAEQSVVVSADATQAQTLDVASSVVTPPSNPQLCRIYADFTGMSGTAIKNVKVVITNLFDPTASSGLSVIEENASYLSDVNGHVEFDVVRGTKVRAAIVTTNLVREFVVPDAATANLLTLLGTATDPFVVLSV